MANNMHFPGESVSFTAPSVAMSMVNVDPDGFSGFTFAVSSLSSLQEPNVSHSESRDMGSTSNKMFFYELCFCFLNAKKRFQITAR